MKIGRRSKHISAKSFFSGPFLRRLNRREKLELAEKSAAAKPVVKARRPAFGLETVEPRLLMSADLSYTTLNDTLTLSIGGTSAAPIVKLSDGSGQLAQVALTNATGAEVDVSRSGAGGGAVSADTLHVDLTNFALLNSFVSGNGGQLTVKFDGGDEFQGTPHPFTDVLNVDGNGGTLSYGLTVQSTSDIDSSASVTATSLTLTSAQTASDLLSTGLFANANTGIDLTGANLTTTAGALTLNATSTLSVSTDGTGMSAVKGAVITSFSSADIDIGGNSALHAAGGDLDITASVNGSLTATASGATVKLIVIAGSAAPEVTIGGGSSLTSTTGAVNAAATTNVTISATATPDASANSAKVDASVLSTTYADGATITVNGGANINAHTNDTMSASSTLHSSTIANAHVANTAGAAVAVSVITGDTTASVTGATVSGSSVSVTAASNRTLTTTALSSPGGSASSGNNSNTSEQTLANNNASTGSSGSVTLAGAIAVSTDTGLTSAFLGNGATVSAVGGVATVSASSVDVVAVTGDGEFTQAGTTGVGVGVAIGVADRTDTAYITGTVSVSAGSLDVAVLAPSASSFTETATSGVGDSTKVGVAGSLGINVSILDHEAYLDTNAVLNLASGTNATFESHDAITNTDKALPSDDDGTSTGVSIGASFAINYGQDENEAYIGNGATLANANNLTLTAIGVHTMQTDATNGGQGATAITPIVATSVADDDSSTTLGTGTLMTIGGALLATSSLTNTVSTNAVGDTKSSKTGVGISLALNIVNDHSTSTTGRDITSGGAMSFLSTTVSGSEAFASASVVGGQQDDGNNDQSTDSQTASQKGTADSTASAQDSKATGKASKAKGTEGAKTPSQSTADGQISVAGGVAVNVNQSSSEAYIADGRTITAGGVLTVKSAANIDGAASATGAAVANAITIDPTKVSTAASTITLASSTLKTGDGVTYYSGINGGGIGGLTSGTKYFANVATGGVITLYDTAAHANAGGATGKITLTSTGGTGQFFDGGGKTGTSVGAAVGVNYVTNTNLAYLGGSTFHVGGLDVEATQANQTFTFNPASAVNTTTNTINLGVTSLATGDGITYTTTGTAIGGLTAGTEYYVNVQADGSVKLYDSQENAVAAGTDGLITLTSAGSGTGTMTNASDDYGASAISGAGGGKTGVAGSAAINITETDTEADLGYTQPSASPGVPTITITGAGNVTLTATDTTVVGSSATPVDGGASGDNLGVGISFALDYAQGTTLAQITNGVSLTGANNLTMTATASQDMSTTTKGGASGSTGVTPVIDIAITDNDADATLGTGAAISLTGAFSATASLNDQVESIATGSTKSDGTGIGITVTVTVVNDNALATTGRNLTTTDATPANGTITFSATDLSSSQSSATASVAGGDDDNGSGNHSDNGTDQSVDNTTKKQSGFGDSEVKGTDSKAKGTEGADSNDKAKSSDGSVSVAGAVAINIENGTAEAFIPDGLTVTATGMLSVTTAAQVNGQAIANGSAAATDGGTGVGVAVAVNVANETNSAYIGNNTVINSGGLTVTASTTPRSVKLATKALPVVNLNSAAGEKANTIFLGLGTGLSQGDSLVYNSNGGTAIGGMTSGTTYYVAGQGDGTFKLYDTEAHAKAGGDTGLIKFTSAGTGTQQFTQQLFGIIPTGTISFNAGGTVTVLDLGDQSDLHTGDVVTYNNGGGSNMGGLTNGTQYYIIDLTGNQALLATSLDNAQAGTAITFGAAGSSSNQALTDSADNNRAEATSGASGGDIGVSVSVGVNVVHDITTASVGDTAALAAPKVTISHPGAITVTATSAATNIARALPSPGGTGGSSVGVGASVGVNAVTDNTTATIIDGTTWAGTAGAMTVSATAIDTAVTHGENGASGGEVSVGVGAGVAVINDTTTAYVGTGSAIAASGNVLISASETGTFEDTTNASAAGSSVAVGASVSVSVVNETVSAQAARSIATTAGTLGITSTATIVNETEATASAKGEDSSDSQSKSGGKSGADGQADKQLNGNSNTSGSGASLPSASGETSSASSTSSSQGGGDSGNVGVAASVAVGVLSVNNTATVTNSAALTATGAITVQAQAGLTDTTQAVGSAISLQSGSTDVGAGVAVGIVNTTNMATVATGSVLTGNGITIAAITPAGVVDTFIVWGAAAAGGTGDAAIAGSVAINVINTDDTEAWAASGSTLHSTGALTVKAINNVNIQTLAAAGAVSDGTSIGAAVDVAILNVTANAFVAGNANATGALTIDAEIVLAPTKLAIPKAPSSLQPLATSVAVAGAAGTGSAAIAGSVIVDVFTMNAAAYIGANSVVSAGSASITALNTSTITGIAGALGATTGAVGIGASLDLEVINKQTFAYLAAGGHLTLSGVGAATIAATSSETMLSVAATAGIGDDAGIAATASIAVINTDTEAYLGNNAMLTAGGAVGVTASSTFFTTMIAGSVGVGSTAGIGAANATLVHSATTKADTGTKATMTAGGTGLTISATEKEDILSIVAGVAVGGTAGVAGSAAVNVLTEVTTADVGAGSTITVNGAGNLIVSASDSTSVISVAGDLAAGGDAGIGVGVDVGTYSKKTNAFIDSGVTATVGGNIEVLAQASENLISVAAGIAVGTVAVGVNAGVHVFTLQTRAFIGNDPNAPTNLGAGNVHAAGSVVISANDASDLSEVVGVLAAGAVGVAAGAGVNVFTKDTESFIGVGANVTGLGGGAGLTVNTGRIDTGISASTSTFSANSPSGQGIQSESSSTLTNAANGNHAAFASAGQVGTPSVGGMDLTGNGNSQSINNSSLSGLRTTSVDTQAGFHGVAVAATNQDEIRTFTVTFGAGEVGIAVSAGVDVVKANTQAYVGNNAQVNTGSGVASGAQSVLVGAGDDFYHLSVGVGVGVGAVGVAPTVGVNVITNTTGAAINTGAKVNAAASVAVEATGSENIVMIGIGAAAGAVGVGAVVDVLSVSNTTLASIGNAASVHAGGNVFVSAEDDTSVLELSGALAGGFVGVGGSVGVMLITKTTDATIGSGANVEGLGNGGAVGGALNGNISGNSFGTTNANGVIVQAQSSETMVHIVAAGAVGYVGVSGAVGLSFLNVTTDATIGANAVINNTNPGLANGNQSVYVNAADNIGFQAYVIGVAGGFVGVTGAVDVGTLSDNIAAVVQAGAVVIAKDNVEVNAVGIQNLTGYVISGAGGAVAAGASVMDWSIGQTLQTSYSDSSGHSSSGLTNGKGDPDSNAASQSQSGTGLVTGSKGIGSLNSGGAQANSNAGHINSATGQAGGMANAAAPTSASILAMQGLAPVNPGTTADIQGGAKITALNIGVTANESATVKEFLGQVAVGVVGAGAAVDILSVADNVTASDDGTNTAGNTVNVHAVLNSNVNIVALDLAAGFVGLGAGVVVVNDNSSTQSTLGSVTKANAVFLESDSTRTLTTLTGQASIGAVGAGATFTEITVAGVTLATVDAGAVIGNVATPVGSLSVTVHSTVTVTESTTAVAAGIGAASANFSFLTVDPTISAAIGGSAVIDAVNAVTLDATSTVDAQGKTFGVAAGGLAVGVSLTEVTVSPAVTADVGTSDQITAGSLSITAATYLPASGYDAQANATGSAGALIGVTSTNTQTTNNDSVNAFIGNAAKVAVVGAVLVTALNNTGQKSSADSNAGGLIAAGLASSTANSSTTTQAYLGTSVVMTAGDLTIAATGVDNNFASTNAGSGGLIAGSSSVANTTSNSTTLAQVGASDNIHLSDTAVGPVNGLIVAADHTAQFNDQITTFAGGLFAGAGGSVSNNVTSNDQAVVGANAMIAAYNIDVTAVNTASKPSLGAGTPNVYGTTGGLVSGAGASVSTTINFTTLVTIGSGAFMTALGVQSNVPTFQLEAGNVFNVNDDLTFETGGAFSGAGANASISVPTDIARVEVQTGAILQSQGALVINARGHGSFDEEVQTDTFGLGTVSVGTASAGTNNAPINAINQVLIDASSMLTAFGDLDIAAGTDGYPDYDQYAVTARYDSYAGALVPISDVNSNAYLKQTNTITISAAAVLKTAQQVNLTAQDLATGNMISFATGVSWASDVADAILTALGGGGVEVHGGNANNQTYSTITNNGTVQTGINSHLTLTLVNNPNFNPADPNSQAVIAAAGSSPTITFEVGTAIPTNPLVAELAYDQEQLALYGPDNGSLQQYYSGEIQRITAVLTSEGLLTNEPGGQTSANPQPELEVTINPIYAEAGEVDVHATEFGGTGTIIAPNSASVTITNNSAASLNLLGIDIPDTNGGLWYDVGLVTTNAQINTINNNNRNSDKNSPPDAVATPAFNLTNVAGGPAAVVPAIIVENKFNINQYNAQHPDAPLPWPSIDVLPTSVGGIGITNPGGSLLLENDPPSTGNITIEGPVNVGTQDIITGGTLVITGVSDEEVGGVPYKAWDAITVGPYVGGSGATTGGVGPASASAINSLLTTPPTHGLTGASITVNADYIDVNGLINAGVSTYNLTINSSVSAEIQGLLNQGYTGLLNLAAESTANFVVDYNTQTKQIVVTSLPVNGGFVSLTGHIVDTGDGTINVFGGYGAINVTNNTNFDLGLQTLDTSQPGQGTLIINDLAKNSQSASTFSTYQFVPGTGIQIKTDAGGSSIPTSNVVGGSTTVYAPAAGWRYGWTIQDSEQTILQQRSVSSNWIGLIPTGSSFAASASVVANGTPTISPSGPYFYIDNSLTPASGAAYNLHQKVVPITTSTGAIITKFHTEISHWYGGHTYSALFQQINGTENLYENDISASRNIAVNFTGGATGGITVTNNGSGNVHILGNVLDPHGATTINAVHGTIVDDTTSALVTGQSLTLKAAGPIGSVTAPIQVVVTGTAVGLNASTISGDVNITAVTGDLTITSVVSGSQGAVNLTSTGGIPTATSGPGLVQGGIITLVAKGGGIGTSTALPILLSTPAPVPGLVDTITATAQTNVYLQEKTGNMLVNSITTGGDVWVNAPNGSILNANNNSTIDTRTQAQLAAGVWTELGLTSSTGYQSKVNNTLASFVGEQNAQYEAYWQDLMAGNTAAPGFSALAAIFGPGGTYAQQDPSYNPNVYYGAAAVIAAPAYFTGNTTSTPAFFTAAGTVQTASVYFTAGSGGSNGTITRTDGGSWVTQGFAVGQAITVGGSNLDSTASASFTITAVTANVITLSPADVIQTEASASNGEAVTVQANASVTRTAGSWLTDGFAVGQTISVSGSAANSTAAGVTYTITAVSAGAIALSPTNVIATEASAGTPETITVTNNKSGTITRTDGGSWIASGFAVGQTITVGGSAGNATSAGETYTIAAITASTITLTASNQIVNEASSALPETVSLQHNTSDGQIAVTGFFTAKAGSTPGSISRTDGGNWLTDGFAVGQTVLVNGSAANSTVGATSYTVTAVSATVLTLSIADAVVGEATAAVPEAFTVQHKFSYQMTASQISTLSGGIKDWTPAQLLSLFGAGLLKDVTDTVVVVGAPDIIGANVTMLTGGGVGTQNGNAITIPLSYPPNAPTVLTTADQIALAGAERVDVQYLAGPAFNATVNFGTNTITRTDGGNWSALAVGESLSIQAVNGQFTQNATDGTIYYKIIAINGTTLTIDPTTPLVAVESTKTVSIAPVILDPSFQASAAAKSVGVYFTANTASSGGTITRTSGSWLTDGFAVGQLVEIGGSLKNATSPDLPDVIVAVTATTITLASNTLVFDEASAATPETISITRGISPKPTAIQIQQITPMNVNATGLISITAKNNVYLDSAIDVRLNQVAAGTTVIGSQIQIKGQQSILNGTGSSTPNLQGGNIILEAAGLNGSAGTIGTSSAAVTIASVGTGTVTARAKGDVAIRDVASTGNAGNLQLETVFSQTGNAYLSATGSITAALDNGFTTIQANNVVLIASGGTIGNIVGGSINYIYLNNPGTVEAIATGNVWVSEGDLFLSFKRSMNALLIGSTTGDVTLRAGLSILDGTNNPTGTQVIGNNITLMALSGGIGLANDPLGIHSAFSAIGNLTASANLANIYIVQTAGTVSLNTVTDPGRSVFITALQGSILNGAVAGVINITAANADLIAQNDIGAQGDRITTQVAVLETLSITGDTEVDNTGALSIGGSFTTNATGAQAGGDVFITASSPVTIVKSMYAVGDIDVIAQNGPVGSTTDGPGNLVVDAVDLKNVPLVVEAGDAIALLAGDNLTIQKGASVKAGFSIYLKSDYQGDLNGFPPRLPPPSQFVTIGTTLLIAGIVIAPNIKIEGGDGPDTIFATNTSILNAAYPWTAKTFPPQLGSFPKAPDTADSLIIIQGDAGNDTITVVGVATALEIDVFGNGGTDIIALLPTNVLIGSDVIFGDNGTVERTSSGVFNEIFSTVGVGGNNDKITVGPALNVIVFGGEGSDTINLANTNNSIVFGDEGELDYSSGLSNTAALTNGIHSDSVILIPPGTLVSAETIDTGVGGNDTITIAAGTKLVFGGPGSDTIITGSGNATVFGDDGQVIYSEITHAMISAISSNPADGTGDTITVGAGNNFIIGGVGNNIITGLLGNNDIIGGNGEFLFTAGSLATAETINPANGGSNKITVGNGLNIILGGNGANTIVAGNGGNLIIANTGEVDYSAPGVLEDAFNTDVVFNDQTSTTVLPPTLYGGNNTITVGSGADMILGGVFIDTITSGNGNSIIFGDNAFFSFNGSGFLQVAESINDSFGGNDVIKLGTGNNIAVGGMASDTISAATGNQIILGDNAFVAWASPLTNGAIKAAVNVLVVAGPLRVVETVDAIDGGNDSITGGNGNDLILGGILNDVITVGTGNSVILGDDGEFDFTAAGLITAETADPGFGGNDTITLGSGKNIVYGGSGADTITATTGNQIIVGDNGTVTWATPGVLQSVVADDIYNSAGGNQSQGTGPMPYGSNDIITGGAGNDLIAGGVGNDTITTSGTGNSVIMGDDGEFDFNATGLLISATTEQLAYGGTDAITLGGGNNIALGGSGADKITAVSGNQIILGDNGTVTYASPNVLQTVVTTDVVFQQIGVIGDGIAIFGFVTYGGNDTITGGSGNDQIAGGVGSDLITTGNGSNDVLGDEGEYAYNTTNKVGAMLTQNPTFGSADTIALGTGSNIAFGGAGADHITAGLGNQIILGDNGLAIFNSTTGVLVLVETTDPTTGDNDVINIGGNGLIMGGVGNDFITTTGTGNSVILGDDGVFTFNVAGLLISATTTDPTVGGTDTIALGTGNNIAFGGTGADTITATTGNQIVVGDDGSVTYSAPGVLQSVQAQDFALAVTGAPVTYGGNDRIALGVGNDSVMGGLGADVITATDGNDLVLGDDGIMTWVNGVITSAATQNPAFGGNDTIILGNGLNVIIGGLGNNIITGGSSTIATGGNTVVGANGDVAFLPSGVVGYVENSDPTFFGNETITTGLGNDRILGGLGTNVIRDAGGSNVIFGADGALTFVDDTIEGDATLLAFSGQTKAGTGGWTIYSAGLLVSAISTDLTSGGNDTILAGGGQNLIVGGFGSSKISAGDGQNIIIGGNGQANAAGAGFLDQVETLAPTATTASNTITAGNGSNIIIGGLGADKITAGNGPDIVFGDAGEVTFSTFTRTKVTGQPFDTVADPVYAEAQSIAPSLGGADTITLGKGNIAVFGGNGNDTIKTTTVTTTGGSAYVVFGGDGQALFNPGGWAKSAVIPFPQYTGTDAITLGTNPAVTLTGAADVLMSTLATPAPQMASGPAPTGENTKPGLVASQIQPVVVEAEAIWAKVLGPNNARLAILNGITVQVGELPNAQIGDTIGDTIYIDSTADGWGWYIDPSASGNAGFVSTPLPGVMTAVPGSAAAGHMDLLSTVLHEMGNVMGFPEDTGPDVTGSVLSAGTRRLPALEGAVGVASGVPMIDWTALNNAAAAGSSIQPSGDGSTWIDNFVTNMGQAGGSKSPNAGIRIKPPGA